MSFDSPVQVNALESANKVGQTGVFLSRVSGDTINVFLRSSESR